MRYRIKEYTIGGDTDFFVSGKIGVEDIRLIINETQKKVICSSMNKSNVACEYVEDMDATFISFSSSICILQPSDKLTIEVDKGDTLTQVASKVEEESEAIKSKIDAIPATDLTAVAKEETLTDGINTLSNKIDNIDLSSLENKVDEGVNTLSDKIDNIDLSAVENKVQEESAAIQGKIDNIKLPEIDLSNVAKQGDNQEATNTAILEAVKAIESRSAHYDSATGNLTIENVNITIE